MDFPVKLEPKLEVYDRDYQDWSGKEEPINEAVLEDIDDIKIEDTMIVETEPTTSSSSRIVSSDVPSAVPEAVGTRRRLKEFRVHCKDGAVVRLKNESSETVISPIEVLTESPVDGSVDGRRFPCHICEKRFLGLQALQFHLNVHSGARPYKCSICSAVFSSKANMTAHQKLHANCPKRYTCYICNRGFKAMTNLRKHAIAHSDVKSFLCGHCGKAFKGKKTLKQHVARHEHKATLECLKCGKVLGSRTEFVKHMRKHSSEDSLTCTKCRLQFEERHLFIAHIETSHNVGEGGRLKRRRLRSSNGMFTCEICGKLLDNLSKYKRHRMVHSNHRPFSCAVCSKAFKRKSHLVEHLGTHSGFLFCVNCLACFKTKCDLDGHRSDSHECRECHQCFRSAEMLRAHVSNHTPGGMSPSLTSQDNEGDGDGGSSKTGKFPCRMCNKFFRSPQYRRLHEEKHKGELYECIFCKTRFVTKGNLRRHFRLYH